MRPTDPFHIAIFEPEYADETADLILSVQRDEFSFSITLDDQPDLADIASFYQRGAGNFWVALSSRQEVVGSIGLLDIGSSQAAIRKVFVHAHWRGPAGVAATLLTTAIDWAQQHHITTLLLGTTEAFRAAHRFYEKHGFTEIDAAQLPSAFPRMALDTRFYRKQLASGASG